MSVSAQATEAPSAPPVPSKAPARPSLEFGDHLTRSEFERRYSQRPDIKKAELIEGMVYLPSPVRFDRHGHPHFNVIVWLGVYAAATPGVRGADNATVRLDLENEPQPDALLRLLPERGGQSQISEDGYVEGGPELVIEVAASSVNYDLHSKLRVYRRSGVREYVVLLAEENVLRWFVLREGVFEPLPADPQGISRSLVFPGLWLDGPALLAGDLARVLAVLQQGLASAEHAAFVERLRTSSPA